MAKYEPLININRPVDKEFPIKCGFSAAPFTAIYYYIIALKIITASK